ncbi:hypothetical protein F9L33_04585 [Amylibacter sp. SFDW26]|uniref:hypothetical protein n=1 Tax=Amylibacter sp. SFDW26 TaxID=2652722 RepID=UPI001262403E|nr:hypothetical protein [Amylibacter sp. SFDW26]KAB7616043.1 hypothetical protein F9L33_04585 [Amylibacter sp. SFDW26]
MRDPLMLSTDQSVCLTPIKTNKNKPKTTQTEHLSYDERLNLARKKLLGDMPSPCPIENASKVQPHKPAEPQISSSYDARLESIRQKLLSDMDLPSWSNVEADKKNTTRKTIKPLVLEKAQIKNSPMCLISTTQTENTKPVDLEVAVDNEQLVPENEEYPDNQKAIFEFHQNEVQTDEVFFVEPSNQTAQQTGNAAESTPPIVPAKSSNKVIYTAPRAKLFSYDTHIKVRFTPHDLPYDVTGVAGEGSTETESWLQKDAMEHYLMLQAQAREYEAKQGATYRSFTHDV